MAISAAKAAPYIPSVVALMRAAALAGQAAPSNGDIAKQLGIASTGTVSEIVSAAEAAGVILVHRGTNRRVVAAPDGAWSTAGDVRVTRSNGAAAVARARSATQAAPLGAAEPTPILLQIPAASGDASPAQYPGAAAGCGSDVSSLNLPPAVEAPRPGGFVRAGGARSCRWPLWGDREKPTGVFCGAAVRRRPGGEPCVYCAQHAAQAFAGRAPAGMPPAAALGGWRAA